MAEEFPRFWLELETELAENNGLNQVKSVLTVLGYLTRSSIATIKTKKKIDNLENEYMKLRSNVNKFEALCERFPDLNLIDSFTPGLIAILTNIVHHVNRNGKSMVEENEELMLLKLVELGKEVCETFSEENVILKLTPSGPHCDFICPTCRKKKSISSSVNDSTGKRYFTIHNFSRHFKTHPSSETPNINFPSTTGNVSRKNQNDTDSFINDIDHQPPDCISCNELKNVISEKDSTLSDYKNRLDELTESQTNCGACDSMRNQIAEKDATILALKASEAAAQNDVCEREREWGNQLREKDEKLLEYDQRLQRLMKDRGSDPLPCERCDGLKEQLQEMGDISAENQAMKAELKQLRQIHSKKHGILSIKLCTFEPIKNDESIQFESDGLVKFTDCRGYLLRLYLDGFYNGYMVNNKFNDMKPYLDAFIDGKTTCVLTHGITGSGKQAFTNA